MNQFPFTNYTKVSFNSAGTAAFVTKYTTTAKCMIFVEISAPDSLEGYNDSFLPLVKGAYTIESVIWSGTYVNNGASERLVGFASYPAIFPSGVPIQYRGLASFPPTAQTFTLHIYELPE